MLTKIEQIRDNLNEWYDPDWYASVYRQAKYAFGESWQKDSSVSVEGGKFPHFPDISVRDLAIGQSRRILGAQFIGLSKVMYNDPEPNYNSLDAMEAELRKQFLLKRWRDTNWTIEEQCAFMEGDAFGLGYLQHGLIKGPNGKQMITVRHSPTLLTLGDRGERNPSRWRGVCFVQYIPVDVARANKKWDQKIVESCLEDHYDGANTQPIKAVRVFEYYDVGYGSGEPTRACIAGDIQGELLEPITANPWKTLPLSTYVHFFAPNMRRATGRVILQMATQEGINEIEDYMRSVMVGGKGFDVADPQNYEAQDIKAVKDGRAPRLVRRTKDRTISGDWERVPPAQISGDTLARLDYLERRFTEESGVTEFDRGNLSTEKRTLGENQLVDQRGQVQGSWSVRQMIAFREQTFEFAAKSAALFDKDQTMIEFFGGQVPANVAQFPESMASEFCTKEAPPKIAEDSMTYVDVKVKQAQRQQELERIFPYVQAGIFNARWWAEEMAKALGEKDLRKALQIPETMGPMQDPMAALGGMSASPGMGPGIAAPV